MTEQFHPLKSVTGLGNLKSVHGFNSFFRNNRIIFSGMILMGIFSCICMVVYGMIDDARRNGSVGDYGFTLGVAAFMILLALFIIFWFLQDWLKNRKFSAALFEGGVATQDQTGKIESVAWKDVNDIQSRRISRRSPYYNYYLVSKDGRVLLLPYFLQGLSDLMKAVKQGVGTQG